LIQFALDHYHVPFTFKQIIYNYYDTLTAKVVTPTFTSNPFHYSIGVFQGCTISPILFDVVFQLLLDFISQPKFTPFSYKFKCTNVELLTSAYADDLQITTSKPEYNQKMINLVDQFLSWSQTMMANPAKCYTLAMKRFDNRYNNSKYVPFTSKSYSQYNPGLSISGSTIVPIPLSGFKYLGVRIEPTLTEFVSRQKIIETLTQHMTTVHNVPLANTAKLFIYNHHVIPRLSWWFATLELSLAFATHLHRIVLPFLKK